MVAPKQLPRIPFLLASLFLTPLLLPAQEALAQAKVTKQGGCKVQVDGLTDAAVGQIVTIKGPGKNFSGKVTVAKPPRALVMIEGESKCPNLNGRAVVSGESGGGGSAGGMGSKSGSSSSSRSSSSSGKPMFGLSADVGYGSVAWQKKVFDQPALSYRGLEFSAIAMYQLWLSREMAIPVFAGVSRFSNSVNLENQTGGQTAKWTFSLTSLMMRLGTGMHYAFSPEIMGIATVFFDYGLSNALAVKGDFNGNFGIKSLMRYGANAGVEYLITRNIGLGVEGSYFMGSAQLDVDELSKQLGEASDVAAHSLSGYAGFGRVSFYF